MQGIAHAALVTRDFDRLKAFYVEVFGAEPAFGGADDTWRGGPGFLTIGDLTLHVFEDPGDTPGGLSDAAAARPLKRGRVDHVALQPASSEEFVAVRERLLAREATTGEVVDFGPVVSLFACDPDGSAVEVSMPRPEEWDPPFALSSPPEQP